MSKTRPLFTVVMPAYGVEKYLAKAVESIESQTFQEWELIIVEDGSPDKTGSLAEKLKEKDARIRVIHHEQNKGLSEARNTGIQHAAGRYIWFMDPDDTVDMDLLQQVADSLEKNRAKLVVFGHLEEYYNEDGSFAYAHEIRPEEKYFTDIEEIHNYMIRLEQETIYGYAWNKVYDLDYIKENKFRYETVRLIEDIVFNINYCNDIDSMNLLNIAPYHYAKRMTGSLTTKFVPDYYPLHRRRIEMLLNQQRYWRVDTPQHCAILGGLYGRYILSALERNCDHQSGMNSKDRKQFCREVFRDPLFQQLLPKAEAKDSKALKITLKCLNTHSTFLCTALGRMVHIVRTGMPVCSENAFRVIPVLALNSLITFAISISIHLALRFILL